MKSFLIITLLMMPLPAMAATVLIPSTSYLAFSQAGSPTDGNIVLVIAADNMPMPFDAFTIDWSLDTSGTPPSPNAGSRSFSWTETVAREDFQLFNTDFVRLLAFSAADLGVNAVEAGRAQVTQETPAPVPLPASFAGLLTALGGFGLLRLKRGRHATI